MATECWLRLRHSEPDHFHALVKMHLSFMLDLDTDDCDCGFVAEEAPRSRSSARKSFKTATPLRMLGKAATTSSVAYEKSSGVMRGAVLTMEGVCQVYQLISFLEQERNLSCEGLLRKHGNLRKQKVLRERLNQGVAINLEENEFSVYEVAAVLKSFLADLPEPILTDACYRAHCQVANMGSEEDGIEKIKEKKINCLQLLFMLIPEANRALLRDLLLFLHKVAENSHTNKMDAYNLGTVLAPAVLCPRKLTAQALQSNHQLLTKATTFMIEEAKKLFTCPPLLARDISAHLEGSNDLFKTPIKKKSNVENEEETRSPVVHTLVSFVDANQSRKLAKETTTDASLAELYAHVQAMPDSARKRNWITKLNEANGQGTPSLTMSASKRNNFRSVVKGEMKHLLTPMRGSSTNSKKSKKKAQRNGYNSYDLLQATPTPMSETPRQPLTMHSFRRQTSAGHVSKKDETDSTPKTSKKNDSSRGAPPPTPKRVSSLQASDQKTTSTPSPITAWSHHLDAVTLSNMITPRSRKPLAAAADGPCQPPAYNEDEPSLEVESSEMGPIRKTNKLKEAFEAYLKENDLKLVDSGSSSSGDEASTNSSLIEAEARLLLNGEVSPTHSLRMIMNGENPMGSNTFESKLSPVDVDAAVTDETDNEHKENQMEDSLLDSNKKTFSSLVKNNESGVEDNTPGRRGRKRRSLTEMPDLNRPKVATDIFFETDL